MIITILCFVFVGACAGINIMSIYTGRPDSRLWFWKKKYVPMSDEIVGLLNKSLALHSPDAEGNCERCARFGTVEPYPCTKYVIDRYILIEDEWKKTPRYDRKV